MKHIMLRESPRIVLELSLSRRGMTLRERAEPGMMMQDSGPVLCLTGLPYRETDASASGNGRSAGGPCAAGLHNFTSRPTSRLLSLPRLYRPTLLRFSPYAAAAYPCVPRVACRQPLGHSELVSPVPDLRSVHGTIQVNFTSNRGQCEAAIDEAQKTFNFR